MRELCNKSLSYSIPLMPNTDLTHYQIFIIPIVFILTSCTQDQNQQKQLNSFYVEILTESPLKDITVEVIHKQMPECLSYFFPIQHGANLPTDYSTIKRFSSNNKTLFEGGQIMIRCSSETVGRTGEDKFYFKLIHPEIAQPIYSLPLKHSTKRSNEPLVYSIKVKTFTDRINNCLLSNSLDQNCLAILLIRNQFPALRNYINSVTGEDRVTAHLFKDTTSIKEHINHFEQIIHEHPNLTEKERIYLLNEHTEWFYGF